ncbi:hypothetical protein NPIL_388201 [Nephila pilipes]|uniref:Uncharacterized protein n=1 Tax=Nephila pilipes TaxID=299642 RepID=A0A8X6Q2Q6_NEPPI|nr:hypothetical protein NPIL_388201 [Nephila pilipes]
MASTIHFATGSHFSTALPPELVTITAPSDHSIFSSRSGRDKFPTINNLCAIISGKGGRERARLVGSRGGSPAEGGFKFGSEIREDKGKQVTVTAGRCSIRMTLPEWDIVKGGVGSPRVCF